MYKKTVLASMIFMGIGLVGCQSVGDTNVKEVEYSSDVKKVKVKSKEVKVTYKDFKISIPKSWDKSTVNDIDIYKIGEREANISVAYIDSVNDLDEYVESTKKYIYDKLGVSGIESGNVRVDGMLGERIDYAYKISDKDEIYIEQVFAKGSKGVYVFTLVSNEEDYKQDSQSMMELLKIK